MPLPEPAPPVTVPGRSPRYQLAISILRWFLVALFLIVGSAKLIGVRSAVALFNAVGALLLARASTELAGVIVLGFVLVGAASSEVFILHRVPVNSVLTLIGVSILARALR
jgi:hypothetical protein